MILVRYAIARRGRRSGELIVMALGGEADLEGGAGSSAPA